MGTFVLIKPGTTNNISIKNELVYKESSFLLLEQQKIKDYLHINTAVNLYFTLFTGFGARHYKT